MLVHVAVKLICQFEDNFGKNNLFMLQS